MTRCAKSRIVGSRIPLIVAYPAGPLYDHAMANFSESDIRSLFDANLAVAIRALRDLRFCQSERPQFQGLSGWVFEQTIQSCLCEELKAVGINAHFKEQEKLVGRAKVDLLIDDKIAIEIKAGGIMDSDAANRYANYRDKAVRNGWSYLYVTLQESHGPFRQAMTDAFKKGNAFFLDTLGDWANLVDRLVTLLRADS